MLLLLRFLLILFLAPLHRRIGILGQSRVRFTVLPHDCDLNIHLNAGRLVSFMDIARVEMLARMRVFRKILRRGWRPIAGGALVRYRRSLLPFERFDVRSRVLGWDEKWYYIEHVAEKDGTVCATGVMRVLIRGKEGNIPPSQVNLLAPDGNVPSPALPDFVTQWIALEDAR